MTYPNLNKNQVTTELKLLKKYKIQLKDSTLNESQKTDILKNLVNICNHSQEDYLLDKNDLINCIQEDLTFVDLDGLIKSLKYLKPSNLDFVVNLNHYNYFENLQYNNLMEIINKMIKNRQRKS